MTACGVLAACGASHPVDEPVRAVRTLTVGASTGARRQDYAAEVRARVESRLAFRVGGKLIERGVDSGDRVRAGQVLARLDAADLRLGADAARAALNAAQVNYMQTESDFRRYTDLRAQGFISAGDLERRDAALKAARAQLDQARAQAEVQAHQSAYSELKADAAGLVTEVYADPGTVVVAGAPVLRLAHDGPRDVVFAVPENQLSIFRGLRGRAGALAVTLWGHETRVAPVSATVREVAGAADPTTRTFLVKADLPAGLAAGVVELGQTATVHAELAPADGTLRLPLAAVAEQGGRSVVWVVDRTAMTVRRQPVTLGRPDGDGLTVTDGLHPGDVVVTAGVHALTPGQRVSLFDESLLK